MDFRKKNDLKSSDRFNELFSTNVVVYHTDNIGLGIPEKEEMLPLSPMIQQSGELNNNHNLYPLKK
jgi:hypothetical protein